MTASPQVLSTTLPPPRANPRPIILFSLAWNVVIALASLFLAYTIFNLSDFGNLGKPVQNFVTIIALVPALLAVWSSFQLLRTQPSGRYTALILYYVGFIFAVVVLLHQWGFFQSFEVVVDSIIQNSVLLLGLPIAYGLYWWAGRFPVNSVTRGRLEMLGVGLGILTLIVILFFANILKIADGVISAYGLLPTWIATIAAAICAFLAWRMLRLGDYFGETQAQVEAWQGWLMLSPNIIGFMFFFAGPLLLSFYLSFTNSTVGQTPEVIGFANYADILALEFKNVDSLDVSAQSTLSFGYTPLLDTQLLGQRLIVGAKDTLFWRSMRNTFVFCLLLVPLSVIPALGLALILNSKLPGVKFYRAVYLPSVAAVVGTALIWRWMYDPTIGFINYTITQVVNFLNNTLGTSIVDPNIPWLTGPEVGLISIVLLSAWQVVGFNTVLFLAGLQGIPKELYEAAQIDGAARWGQFRNVTIPMLGPTTFFVIITTVITGLQVFNEPYALFPSRPIPVDATTAVFYLYNRGFFRFEFGYASAISWMLFGIIFLVTLTQFRLSRSNAYE